MARRKNAEDFEPPVDDVEAPVDDVEVAADEPANGFEIEDADLSLSEARRLAHEREKPNPFAGLAQITYDSDTPKMVRVGSEKEATQVMNLLRKDARRNDLGMAVQTIPDPDRGGFKVIFKGKQLTKRQVSNAEVKAWAEENGLPVLGGGKNGRHIPTETRAAYKEAHGIG